MKTVSTTEMRLVVIMVPYVLNHDLVFLQDSAACPTATTCSDYLQLVELLNLLQPVFLKFLFILSFQMIVSG